MNEREEQESLNLIDLPIEVQENYISELNEGDRKNLSLTCKFFNKIIEDSPFFWKHSCNRAGIKIKDHDNYKDVYKKATTIDIDKEYYTVGSPIQIYKHEEINLYGHTSSFFVAYNISKNKLINSFSKKNEIEIFISKNEAHKFALELGKKLKIDKTHSSPAVFTIKFENYQSFFSPSNVNDFNTKNKNIKILEVYYKKDNIEEINVSLTCANKRAAPNLSRNIMPKPNFICAIQ